MLARCFAGLRLFPEVFFQALGRARKAARDEIKRLIVRLDLTIDVGGIQRSTTGPCDGKGDADPSPGSPPAANVLAFKGGPVGSLA